MTKNHVLTIFACCTNASILILECSTLSTFFLFSEYISKNDHVLLLQIDAYTVLRNEFAKALRVRVEVEGSCHIGRCVTCYSIITKETFISIETDTNKRKPTKFSWQFTLILIRLEICRCHDDIFIFLLKKLI